LIRLRRIKPICIFGVGQLPFRDLDQFVSAVHISHRTTASHANDSRRSATVEQPRCSDRDRFAVTVGSPLSWVGAGPTRPVGSSLSQITCPQRGRNNWGHTNSANSKPNATS
jgi:hypothetical protein